MVVNLPISFTVRLRSEEEEEEEEASVATHSLSPPPFFRALRSQFSRINVIGFFLPFAAAVEGGREGRSAEFANNTRVNLVCARSLPYLPQKVSISPNKYLLVESFCQFHCHGCVWDVRVCVWRVRYFLWPPLQKQEERGKKRLLAP